MAQLLRTKQIAYKCMPAKAISATQYGLSDFA